mmetsp:Transcript_27703/g.46543  ORF Transcript_27703/g.46543 Transcript_27703/m.46543 type:complete len:115 (-) Transcript_27703:2089-2433(-)|eukprot:CAMPEP_0174971348 /NCGR_PEP_ID=MMETSP0004_2-20121128/9938_1 /TAXON_ID=420556 /ORGANISM="Ochromonas sp., Strain CCMP1393" /LENGTH=114 /DNA_ID=CAMNT_0016221279 /DNA_START=114 /DNA_END=458 /DNA_ORIENTATION=+
MSDKYSKSGPKGTGNPASTNSSIKAVPGKGSFDNKPKKAAVHRKVIADAAKYNQEDEKSSQSQRGNQQATATVDDYEGSKVCKSKSTVVDDDIKMVQELGQWDDDDDDDADDIF